MTRARPIKRRAQEEGQPIREVELGTDRMTALRFRERPPHKKGELFRRLLIKQWSGPLPTIRIRIR